MTILKKQHISIIILILSLLQYSHGISFTFNKKPTTQPTVSELQVLSQEDISIYKSLLLDIKNNNFKLLNKKISKLKNTIILDYILAELYLGPKYKTKYSEAVKWLKKYPYSPQATDIYKLALLKAPSKLKKKIPKPSQVQNYFSIPSKHNIYQIRRATSSKARSTYRKISYHIKEGSSLTAKRLLLSKQTKKILTHDEYYSLASSLATLYFINNQDELALEWGLLSSNNAGKKLNKGSFTAGLVYWKKEQWENATKYFIKSYNALNSNDLQQAKSAFWAGRSLLNAHKTKEAFAWFKKGSKYPYTFYGLMCYDMLGLPLPFNWKYSPKNQLTSAQTKDIHIKRAKALIEIGLNQKAGDELLFVWKKSTNQEKINLAELAIKYNIANFSIRISNYFDSPKYAFYYHNLKYPTPFSWRAKEQYEINPSLIFALIKQESKFDPQAQSQGHAYGLMQIQPQTARWVNKSTLYLRKWQWKLYIPKLNILTGEKYIQQLIKQKYIDNLFSLLISWNAGPGTYLKWRKQLKTNDSLMFLENIPNKETRNFIYEVISNLWIYNYKLNYSLISLHKISQNKWAVINDTTFSK